MAEIAWEPTPEYIERSNIIAQMRRWDIPTYDEFLRLSCGDPEWFWRAFFDDVHFEWMHPYAKVCDTSNGRQWAKWFPGGKLNWTYNAVDAHVARGNGEKIAIRWEGEEGTIRTFTYRQLENEVNKLANALLALGTQRGDRVGLWLPFIPECAAGLLAIARIGAIAVPIFSGYGPEPAAVRLNDSEARILITADGFLRRSKLVPLKSIADEALRNAPSVKNVIVVKRAGSEIPMQNGRDVWYNDILSAAHPVHAQEAFDSETPYMLIYTSGTTGKPKGAVHLHAGFPLKSAQDMFHIFDVHESDTVTWLSDIGWMMGPWLISGGLILGATVFMYDGAPDYPHPDRIWQAVDQHRLSVLGLTPTFIRTQMLAEINMIEKRHFPSLRIVGSTGEPWNPDAWMWTMRHVCNDRVPIINYSGGTEIAGGILGCASIRPLKPCSFNSIVPGVAAVCLNEQGEPVINEIGLLGITNINPGMTRGFWRDPARFESTYWSQWKDVWYHGDLVKTDEEGYWYILGRADDTLKIGGKRLGPSEMESVLAEHPAVAESAVIGVPDELKGQAAVAFAVLAPEFESSELLNKQITLHVQTRMGKSFKPQHIIFVEALPKTRNGKIMRRVVRNLYLGEDPGDLSSLENPNSVDSIRNACSSANIS